MMRGTRVENANVLKVGRSDQKVRHSRIAMMQKAPWRYR
jgi:hypothetical protein